jgi:hypothetical protein
MSWMFALAMAPSAVAAAPAPSVAAQVARLEGQRFTVAVDGTSYTIEDVGGEGPPRVGTIERRGHGLYLIEDSGQAWRLSGPLARPRIAGPGYRVWVLGEASDADAGGGESTLRARRLGVLAPPPR